MQERTSVNNPQIKAIGKLSQKKYREESGYYLIEGFHLVEEALKAKAKYREILATPPALKRLESLGLEFDQDKLIKISEGVARHLSSTKNSQDVFMTVKINQPEHFDFNYGKWVLLDDLADPGNVGTIIRTADAAGFDGVILSNRTVDLYNPKVQRSMQGSQFHLSLIKADLPEAIASLQAADIPVYASLLDPQAKQLGDFAPQAQVALIIGNEAHGVSADIAALADEKLYIPIKGRAESLNAAVAAGIMIYHFS
ncbi:rRNA methyltransferase [Lactobacillus nasalidis]|uniref:rRNA methyltransferase n=1 Tax=Lactobacillus nasalidis TaxID=2797258 RepID=A0ABQ3W6A0_9LACO|nr:RNA methyltransferase [Lactobacillus nasalidis]GHV97442.1 rRNA methyltransferase [Lactobacillus nasalidis]GHV98905.1 rRNA methyltransferase [Lactobacillus nasalidis]GHW02075.1 rRNA methyltransferase [Lactobacillus nasalidis]